MFSWDARRAALVGALCIAAAGGCATPAADAPVPGADPRFAQAEGALEAGANGRAADVLAGLARDYPELAAPAINLGIALAAQGRDADAEAAFRRALAAEPGHPVALAELAIVLRRQGRLDAAEEAYRAALARDPGYGLAWRTLGVLMDVYLGRPEEALDCYRRYRALAGPGDPEVEKWIAELEIRLAAGQARR